MSEPDLSTLNPTQVQYRIARHHGEIAAILRRIELAIYLIGGLLLGIAGKVGGWL